MPVPSISSHDEHSKPPRPSPPPSWPSAIASPLLPSFLSSHVHLILDIDTPARIPSIPCSPCGAAAASISGVRPSGLCSPPAQDVSCVTAKVPRLAGSDQFDDLGEFDVADSGPFVGTQICAILGNRTTLEQDGSPTTKEAINRLQMGSLDSLDPDVPVGNPSGSSESQVVHQMTEGGLPLSEKILECGPLGTQMVCPDPPPISVEDVVAGTNALNPVSGPSSSASSSVSWASIVGQH